MASTNRFVKVDGTFERVGNRIIPLDEINAREQAGPLLGSTSNAAGSPLPLASATATAPAPAQDPYDSFNLLMTDMLKSAQGLNTADLLKKKRTLERASIDRTQEVTDRDMRTLSPSQQSAIRSGRTGALSAEIDDNAYQLEKAQQSIDAFFRVHGEAQKIGQEWADKMVAPESVIASAVQVIQADPDRMATVLAGFNDKTKQKIIESLDYTKLTPPSTTTPNEEVIPMPSGGDPFVSQPNYEKLTAAQKKQADSLNNLVRTLKEYRETYDANPGALGGAVGNMFGADAGLLQTKVNAIIFAAAQAEGTGALQQADREVIEQIIPNPTNFSGALNTAFKGGKAGNIGKIDDQINKYIQNLAGYGLTPVTTSAAAAGAARSNVLIPPDGGAPVDASALTAEEYQQALTDGYTPQ